MAPIAPVQSLHGDRTALANCEGAMGTSCTSPQLYSILCECYHMLFRSFIAYAFESRTFEGTKKPRDAMDMEFGDPGGPVSLAAGEKGK